MNAGITGALDRRASLLPLGRATLAGLAGSVTADAKKNKNKNKADKKARKRCKKQAGQCTDFVIDSCGGDPSCLETLDCCEFAGRCDAPGFLDCLIFRDNG